ncbi:MAG TPA: hypothetical protein VFA35_04435, partial [Burkholderiaceae bacterium]|nr:hypothetical protein [Burkholderiaceae bacterium]
QNTTLTQYLPGSGLLAGCNGVSLSADGRRLAVTSTAPSLLLIDVRTGALLQNIALPGASNIYTTAWQDLRPGAVYAPYGAGCAGSLGVPTLGAAAPPALGTFFQANVGNLPGGVAFMVTGFSATANGPTPLPLDLGPLGMPGCSLLAEAALTTLLLGGTTATWQLAIPNDPTYLGFTFYNQGFALDPPANALGLTVSNGAHAVIGI